MTDLTAAPVHIGLPVRTVHRPAPATESLSTYLALADRFGREQVYLLESAGDGRSTVTGFGVLLTVSVTRGAVRVEGVPALRERVGALLRPWLEGDADRPRLRAPRDLWPLLRAVQAAFDAEESASRFGFGFLAYLGYDAVRYIEELPYLIEQEPDLPDVQLVLHQGCVLTDLRAGRSELLLHESAAWPALDPAEVLELLAGAGRSHPLPAPAGELPAARVEDDTDRATFVANVARCIEHIAAGDIYQVQIGHELTIDTPVEPVLAYQRLRDRNASPFMYLTPVGDATVVGASPESFVQVEDGEVRMRPIAGTIPRGRDGGDEAAADRLRSDPKELAEHTMLVDLCRNDIGRICRRDTLAVPSELVVERYSHVLHLVSTVVGRVDEDIDSFDVIAALFPAGTMTGAPKIRAMEIIEETERSRRGLYAGALGLIGTGGYVNLALCIRTLIHRDGRYRTRSSAGIVADSDAGREWTETLAKSSAAYWAVTGRELL